MLLTPSRISKYLFAVFIIVVLVYAYFEAQNLLFGPKITLASEGGAITVRNELIDISGTVENVSSISLDGRPVVIRDTGEFTERILLAEGINTFTFIAADRFGRKRSEVLHVVYIPPPETEQNRAEIDMIEETE